MENNSENKQLTYESALAELKLLVEKVNNPEASFEQIENDLKRAMELIKYCKGQLKGYVERFAKLQGYDSVDDPESDELPMAEYDRNSDLPL